MHTLTLACASLLALSLCACGGKVIFSEGSGGTGASGTTAASGTTGKGSTTSTASSNPKGSSSTGINPNLCDQFCAVVGNCINSPCQQSCQQLLATPGCKNEAAAYATCLIGNFNSQTCALPGNACQAEASAFSSCQGPPPDQCQQNNCGGDAQNCTCDGQCFGQAVTAQCTLLPSPTCQCFVNGQLAGSCSQGGGNACSLDQGCCSQFFSPQPG